MYLLCVCFGLLSITGGKGAVSVLSGLGALTRVVIISNGLIALGGDDAHTSDDRCFGRPLSVIAAVVDFALRKATVTVLWNATFCRMSLERFARKRIF